MTQQTYRTPRGAPVVLNVRPDTNDEAMVAALLGGDEYRLKDQYLSGWALDIGAHVGTIGIALAIDNPSLRVIAIEPVPDNAALIRRSIEANALTERVFCEEAAAGAVGTATTPCQYAYTHDDNPDKGYIEQSRFVGNVFRPGSNPIGTLIDAPVVTLPGLAAKYGVDSFRFAKIDCEGCEYAFLEDASLIEEIIGEWHDGPFSLIADVLSGYTVEMLSGGDTAGIGMFRAVRK